MKVKAIKDYNDLKLKKLIKAETELDVTAARGAELIKAGVAVEIENTTETPAAETPEKKTTRKKKEASK